MECPKCRFTVNSKAVYCPKCGFNLEWMNSFSKLRESVSGANSDLQKISLVIQEISNRINLLEKNIRGALTQGKTETAKEEKTESKPDLSSEMKDIQLRLHQKALEAQEKEPLSQKNTESAFPCSEKTPLGHDTPSTHKTTELLIGQKWLLIAGIIIMVLGLAYFLKYAMDQNWINPSARIFTGYLSGTVLLILGEKLRKKLSSAFGLCLIGGGIAALYLSTFAGFQIYHLFGQIPAFFLLILVTVFASTLSVVYEAKWLSVLGLAGGFATPVLLSTGTDNAPVLFSYMTLLNLGLLSIAVNKQWMVLNRLGFLFTWTLFSGWYLSHYSSEKFLIGIFFCQIFFMIYALLPFLYFLKNPGQKKFNGTALLFLNSLIAFGYGFAMIKPLYGTWPSSLLALLYSAFFMFLAQTAHKKGLPSTPRTLMISKAVLFLILAVPLLFSGHWITLFWLILSMVLYWSGVGIKSSGFQNTAIVLFLLSLIKFLFWDCFHIFHLQYLPFHFSPQYSYLAVERLFSEIFITGCIYCSLLFCMKRKDLLSDSSSVLFLFNFIFIFFLFSVLTVETDAFFYQYFPSARFASISVLWTLFSLSLMGAGFFKNIAVLRYLSLSLFLITLIKAFFIDMSHISTPFRIISFLVLGMVMILASFFYHLYKGKINENDPSSF